MTNYCPIYEITFLKQSVDFFVEDIGGTRDRGAIGKIGNDKKVIRIENRFEETHADRCFSR